MATKNVPPPISSKIDKLKYVRKITIPNDLFLNTNLELFAAKTPPKANHNRDVNNVVGTAEFKVKYWLKGIKDSEKSNRNPQYFMYLNR